MARSKTSGDNQRKGAIKTRSQIRNPLSGTWTKRDEKPGKFSDFAGIQIVDPAVKPRRVKVEAIRKAVRAYYK
mgnify:CR=1 FL=1